MPAPLVWAAIVGGAAAVGLAADALWGDEDTAEAARAAGVDPEVTNLSDLTPEQVSSISEELAKLPPESQARAQQVLQSEMQSQQASGGTTSGGTTGLGGLSGDLAPEGEQQGGNATDQTGFVYEGYTFAEPPPSPGELPADTGGSAARRGRNPFTDGQDMRETLADRGSIPAGPGRSGAPRSGEQPRTAADSAIGAGHTPSALVVPYLESLYDWARSGGRTEEGFYRSRYYRQESMRLTGELQQRRARAGDSSALSDAERSLRDFYDSEGSLTPWESHTAGILDIDEGGPGLLFPETDIVAPRSRAGRIAERIQAGRPAQDREAFGFAPFRGMADRDSDAGGDMIGSVVSGLSGMLDDSILSAIDQAARLGDPNNQKVYVRRSHSRIPGGSYRADTSSIRGIERTERALAEASSFTAGKQELVDELHRMSDKQVEDLQVELWKAGFYGQSVPIRGDASDGATLQAFEAAIEAAAGYARAGEVITLEEVIERRQEQFADRLGELASGARGLSRQQVQVTLEDPAALRELVEQTAIETIGAANLSEQQIQSFVAAIHGAQRTEASRRVSAVNEALENWQPETPWDEPPEAVFGAGGVQESEAIAPGARAEDFIEAQRPGEAAATDYANTYGSFLDIIGAR